MTTRTAALIFALIAIIALPPAFAQEAAMAKPGFAPLMGGCGGAYFMAEPGELVIEVVKRDRNRSDVTTELRALLVSPDRRVLQEEIIPDDGEPQGQGLGPPQTVTLRTQVQSPGIYALNITVTNDPYGNNMRWGFRTNCEKYLVETARGHRDRRHEEPIVLNSRDESAVITFQPRDGEFNIEVAETPEGSEAPTLYAADGALVGTLQRNEQGVFTLNVPPNEHRGAVPWQLRLPNAWCSINAGGLTRWDDGDPIVNSCLWTPDPDSWFAFIPNRWLLTPYHRYVYAEPGDEGEVMLRAHNNANYERFFDLAIEFAGDVCPVELESYRLTLGPNEAAQVPVRYTMPAGGGEQVAHIRVTPFDTPEVSTYASVILKPGEAPAAEPLEMPIQLQPYAHENAQFGYLPQYPLEYQPYFDLQNRPYMRTDGGITTWRDGEWVETLVNDAITSWPEGLEGERVYLPSTKIAFDAQGGIYLPASIGGGAAILHSSDGGRTFAAYQVPDGGRGTIDIEQFSGHNVPDGPPPFVFFQRTATDPNLRWRSLNDLSLYTPRLVDGTLEIGEPLLITHKCIGLSAHSGIPSSLVSRGDRIYVAWGEATDPDEDVPGVPTYVGTYDRATGTMAEPALIGYGPPANDVHNSPSITMDSEGDPQVLIGTHGRPFQYSQPLEDGSGWTEPVLAGEGLRQTYIGFVCGPDDTLDVVFRLWQRSAPYPAANHATLAYQRKRPGQPWGQPRILLHAPFSEYSVFYHRLTIDRRGRLFISYDYWSTFWFYRNDHPGSRRALMMSPDGGETWKMASNEDLVGG